jgi:AraC-like DNA-binding protein
MPSRLRIDRRTGDDGERIVVRRMTGLDVELLEARSLRHSFDRHAHDTIAIGVIDAGVGEFWCRGGVHCVPPDTMVLIDAGEVHTGGVARGSESLWYRMVYLSPSVASALTSHAWTPFSVPSAHAPPLATTARRFHDATAHGSRLAGESALCDLIVQVSESFSDGRRAARTPRAPGARRMAELREFLHANVAADVSLIELARLADLTPSYVSREFRRQFGLPPHAYQLQLRLGAAKRQLRDGSAIAATAVSLGFVDQAHFSAAFKRTFGITPGRYQRGIRASQS